MLTIYGAKALSSSKSDKLLTKLNNLSSDIEQLHAHFCHFVEIIDITFFLSKSILK